MFQISVKRLIMDNTLIRSLMNETELNPIHGKEHSSNISKDDIKSNVKNVKAIFGLVEPDFLLRQIQPDKLVNLNTQFTLHVMFYFVNFTCKAFSC